MTDRTEKLDEMMDHFVYGLLSEKRAEQVRRKIEEDPEWQLAYEAAVARSQALGRAVRTDEAPASARTGHLDIAKKARQMEMGSLRRRKTFLRVVGAIPAAAVLLILLSWGSVALVQPPQSVLRLVGQSELAGGAMASLRVIVQDLAGHALSGVPVSFALRPSGGGEIFLGKARSNQTGSAELRVKLPDRQGKATLVVYSDDSRFSRLEVPINLQRVSKVYLSTDKPIYQPGQTIHIRCLVLRKPDLTPDAGKPVEFTVTDPSGNVIFRRTPRLSEYGIAWTDLSLDELITPGRYVVKAAAGADASEQTVEIYQYRLPAFSVKASTDRPYYLPGQAVSGTVDMRYHFGKAVVGGKLQIELRDCVGGASEAVSSVVAATDESGRATFELTPPSKLFGLDRTQGQANLLLTVRGTDSAGQENVGYLTVPVANQDIRLSVVAENGRASRGLPTRLYIVASYPDGRPAKARLDVQSLGQGIRTDDAGVAVIETSHAPDSLRIVAHDDQGRTGKVDMSLPTASQSFVLRTDKPFYKSGQTMSVEALSGLGGDVYLDVIKDRQTVLTRSLVLNGGRGAMAVDIPAELSGTLRLHAYALDPNGGWVGRDLLVVVESAGMLDVDVSADKSEYRPGEDARLSFKVTGSGSRAVPAALSLSAVDEAVYSVQQAAPGLEGLLGSLDEDLLVPAIEAHGFSTHLMGQDEDYARAVLAAAVADMPGQAKKASALERISRGGFISTEGIEWLRDRGPGEIREAIDRFRMRDQLSPELIAELLGGRSGISLDRSTRYSASAAYERARQGREDLASTITGIAVAAGAAALLVLLCALSRSWGKTLAVTGIIIVFLAAMFTPTLNCSMELTNRKTVDSQLRALATAEIIRRGEQSMATPAGVTDGSGGPAATVRTRSYFPETLLWRPQVITDANGRAELTVPLADSVTTWRLSGSAISKGGRLGRVASTIRVFQPFFVEINAPPTLTAGDEVSVPLVLYNYTDGPLSVSLESQAADGLAVVSDADAPATVDVPANQVVRAYVRVRAEQPGQAVLTVRASSPGVADAIRREIAIVPPGRPVSFAVGGVLEDGSKEVELPLPADAVPGSMTIRMKVYPSRFSELMDGLENIFRMPHGCFEQTSSTTYPNIMALSYMKAHGLARPEVAAKAQNYINLGKQRLIGFEVSGGGFSLYGRPPANVAMTAYGLMEFADMAKVEPVDDKLLVRTAKWLADRQARDGSWSGGLPMSYRRDGSNLAVTAYVTWAISMYDADNPAAIKGRGYIKANIASVKDAHTLALCANALQAGGDNGAGDGILRRLSGMAQQAGKDQQHWSAFGSHLTYSCGRYGDVETTALAALALSHDRQYTPLLHDALRWLAARKDPRGTWGTTQATVLALKALLAGENSAARRNATATVVVRDATADDAPPAELTVAPDQSDVVHTMRLPQPKTAGPVRMRIDGRNAAGMGYQVVVRYHTLKAPASDSGRGPLDINVEYDRTELRVGESLIARVTITNNSSESARVLLADVGTPPGFSVDPSGLDKLQAQGKIDRYTVAARGVILYIPQVKANARLDLSYKLIARMPLSAVAAPTRLYPYYDPDSLASDSPARFTVK